MTGGPRRPARGRTGKARWGLVWLCVWMFSLGVTVAALGQNAAVKKLNPFTGKPEAVQQGRTLWLQYGCSGCHGVMGGGGMAMPVSDDTWKFGSDDETLYKLIKGRIDAQTMPKIYDAMPDDELWKIIAYVRSVYAGDKSKVNW
jgi:mono/diheme cytochrome c family protein